ncbi:MAG: hypothetical protein GY811_19065, partial [Myxococcales bacterium]|nr:hypothetical protein [Myxococcales bacterium]
MTQTSAAAFGAEKPLFRYDLQTEAIEDGGQRFVEVGDPDGGASFRFFEVEYAVACGMDGERDIAALVAWAKTELDLKTNADELGAIVSKLSELQYLGGSEQPQAASSSAQAPKPGPVDEVASLPEIAATPPRVERSSSIDVDLGSSGKSPIAVDRPPAPINVDDVELGVAGASSDQQRAGGDANADAGVELGVAGNEDVAPEDDVIAGPSKEVSTDLSQNFRIDKDEVQAAVRASQVMTAVEMPKDLEDELAASKAAAQKTDEDPIPEDVLLVADISESISDEASDDSSDAIVLPDPPAQVAAASAAEEDASRVDPKKVVGPRRNSASMVLWVILLLAAALGAGYYYMEYVREQPGEKGPDIAPQQAAAKRKAKPKPKAPEAKLAVSEVPTADVSAPRSGVVSWVLAASSDVAEGDEIVKLVGFERAD